jgi:Putative Flp pilus-assembly TadE/G-like
MVTFLLPNRTGLVPGDRVPRRSGSDPCRSVQPKRRDRRTSRDSPAGQSWGRPKIADLATDSGGNVLVIMALFGLALIVTLGAAVDVARWISARQDTHQAVDAALLSVGRALQLGKTDAEANAVATTYYRENSRRLFGGDGISFRVVDDGLGITAKAPPPTLLSSSRSSAWRACRFSIFRERSKPRRAWLLVATPVAIWKSP